MKSKTHIFTSGTDAKIADYRIFERMVYDSETELYKKQNPKQWSTSPTFTGGQTYLSTDTIRSISKNYNLYAVWPDVYVKFIYNYLGGRNEVSSVLSGATVTLKQPTTSGFKGWLDKNSTLHQPGEEIAAFDNTQMYMSACYDLSVSYDLNGGYLEEGKQADKQAAQYSTWVGTDLADHDIKASLQIAADDPLNKNGSIFKCWSVGSQTGLQKGDTIEFGADITAIAQWLFNHTYTFYELCSFNGTAPSEKYGEIETVSESYDDEVSVKVYKAEAEDGYKFDKWEVVSFDGTEVSPAQTLTDPQIEVSMRKVQAAETRMDLYVRSTAYFSFDDSWSLVYNAANEVMRRARISGTATNAALKTKDDTTVKKVLLGDEVTALEDSLFSGCSKLDTITMSSVTSIGKSAFYYTAFSSIDLPSVLQTIGDSAFYWALKLSSIAFKSALKKIGASAFYGSGLRSVSFDSSIASLEIGSQAFAECKSLASFEFPTGCSKVGSSVFSGCTSLTEVTIDQTSLGVFDDNALAGSSIVTLRLKGISASDIMG